MRGALLGHSGRQTSKAASQLQISFKRRQGQKVDLLKYETQVLPLELEFRGISSSWSADAPLVWGQVSRQQAQEGRFPTAGRAFDKSDAG